MQSAKNLHVYAKALELAKVVYAITGAFPGEERFGLTSQMRRAAVSIGSNIAEGCGRRGDKELTGYLHIALGSASELEFQCELAIELGYVNVAGVTAVLEQVVGIKRMLSRLIKAIAEKKPYRATSTV
ncbi:MAG: four helix bundle protein [Gemmatimonadota bacterium]|nr:four helix bundle protein [Gemmatimonadota bacterium]